MAQDALGDTGTMTLDGKVVLVTGGARRLGRETALALARAGADVAVHYRSSAQDARATRDAIRALGRRSHCVKADLARADEIARLFDEVMDAMGRIDVLVNNAALFGRGEFLGWSEQEWNTFMDVNLKAPFLCAQHAARLFPGGKGRIVNIADVGGIVPWKGYEPYCVSKAGLIMLTKCMAKSLAPGVLVNAVAPGPVLLPEGADDEERRRAVERTVLGREGAAGEVAEAVRYLVESDYVTGTVLVVDGGRLLA